VADRRLHLTRGRHHRVDHVRSARCGKQTLRGSFCSNSLEPIPRSAWIEREENKRETEKRKREKEKKRKKQGKRLW
jgi:hypothetical protein